MLLNSNSIRQWVFKMQKVQNLKFEPQELNYWRIMQSISVQLNMELHNTYRRIDEIVGRLEEQV